MIDSPQGSVPLGLARTRHMEVQHFADGGLVRHVTERVYADAGGLGARDPRSKVAGLKNGGPVKGLGLPSHADAKSIVDGGPIRGPGTPTSDSVPLWGSKDEFMLPADTTAIVGKDVLQDLVDQTHTPVGRGLPKPGGVARANGGMVDPMNPIPTQPASFGDAAAAAYNPGVTQVPTSSMGLPVPPSPITAPAPANAAGMGLGTPGTLARAAQAWNPASGVGRPNPLGSLADTKAQIASLQAPMTGLGIQKPATTTPTGAPAAAGTVAAAPSTAATTPATPAPAPAPVPPAVPPQPYTNRNATMLVAYRDGGLVQAQPEGGFGVMKHGQRAFADGGVVDDEDPVVKAARAAAAAAAVANPAATGLPTPAVVSAPAPVPVVAPAAPPAVIGGGPGAAFGIYPRPSSRFSTNANDAALQRGVMASGVNEAGQTVVSPAVPVDVPPAPAAPRMGNLTDPRSTQFADKAAAPAVVAATPVAAPAPVIAPAPPPDPTYPAAGSVTQLPGAIDTLGQVNRDIAHQQYLQKVVNPNDPTPGLAVINPGFANRNDAFNEQANLRNALAKGSWSPRKGYQGDDTAVAAALTPIQQRVQAAMAAQKDAGDTQRSLIAERGAEARSKIEDARQGQLLDIQKQRLGIEAAKAGQDGVPSGYRRKADGSFEFVPGGPADPNTPKGKNALTEDQAKSAGYAVRMENALKLISGVGATNPGATRPGLGTALINSLPEALANKVRPEDRQRVESAQLDALDAALTLNTGAAYTREQLQGLSRSYFAQPGDADKTVAEKQGRLNSLIDTARLRAGQAGSALADTAVQKATAANATAPAATSTPAALPSGMSRQVGTSKGKPVYEDAQGNRFVGG